MTTILAKFSEIHADDLSCVKKKLETIGFELDEIRPQSIQGERSFFFLINASFTIVDNKN